MQKRLKDVGSMKRRRQHDHSKEVPDLRKRQTIEDADAGSMTGTKMSLRKLVKDEEDEISLSSPDTGSADDPNEPDDDERTISEDEPKKSSKKDSAVRRMKKGNPFYRRENPRRTTTGHPYNTADRRRLSRLMATVIGDEGEYIQDLEIPTVETIPELWATNWKENGVPDEEDLEKTMSSVNRNRNATYPSDIVPSYGDTDDEQRFAFPEHRLIGMNKLNKRSMDCIELEYI